MMGKSQHSWTDVKTIVSADVPKGRVITYGEIARVLYPDLETGGRVVGMLIKTWVKKEPHANLAHRVVDNNGKILQSGHAALLGRDGVTVIDEKVDPKACGVKLPASRVQRKVSISLGQKPGLRKK